MAEQVPTEFRYWQQVSRPAVQRARKAWRTVCRFDPQPSDEYVRRFAQAYYDTDPVRRGVRRAPPPARDRPVLDRRVRPGRARRRRLGPRHRDAGAHHARLHPAESYLPAFAPKPGSPWRKRVRDEIEYRALIGYTRFWMLPQSYRSHDMPRAWPWAVLPLLQAPVLLTLETLRRVVPALDRAADRSQRRRRESWYRNQMGERRAEFQPTEQLRR